MCAWWVLVAGVCCSGTLTVSAPYASFPPLVVTAATVAVTAAAAGAVFTALAFEGAVLSAAASTAISVGNLNYFKDTCVPTFGLTITGYVSAERLVTVALGLPNRCDACVC